MALAEAEGLYGPRRGGEDPQAAAASQAPPRIRAWQLRRDTSAPRLAKLGSRPHRRLHGGGGRRRLDARARWRCWRTRGTCSPTSARWRSRCSPPGSRSGPRDDSKTYGYLRWEILAALVNGAALFGIAVWVVVEAIAADPGSAADPDRVVPGGRRGGPGGQSDSASRSCTAARDGSLNVRGAYLHVLGDALGSVGAVAAAAIIALTGWTLADPIVSILLSLLILVGAWRLLRESTDILLESVPRPRLHGGSAAPDAGGAGRRGGARSPRLDRHQRDGRDERPRRGARSRGPSRRAGRHPGRDVAAGDRPRHDPARGASTAARGCDDARESAHRAHAGARHWSTSPPSPGTVD